MKVAKLVAVSLLTRVIVEDTTTEFEIITLAKEQFVNKIKCDGIGENIEFIQNDEECPYNPDTDISEDGYIPDNWDEIKL